MVLGVVVGTHYSNSMDIVNCNDRGCRIYSWQILNFLITTSFTAPLISPITKSDLLTRTNH